MKHRHLLSICLLLICMALTTSALACVSTDVTPGPSVPIDVYAAPGDSQAAVSFNPGTSSDTNTPFTYTVTATDTTTTTTTTATGAGSPIIVTDLTNGDPYIFTVTATDSNLVSSQQSAPSNSVIPSVTGCAAWTGTWNVTFFATGADASWFQRCTQTVNADCTVTNGSCTDSNGSQPIYNGTNWLFPYGMWPMTFVNGSSTPSDPNALCYGDSSNSIVTCTQTFPDGSTVLSVGTNQAASYASTDLSGTWEGLFLTAGQPNQSTGIPTNSCSTASVTFDTSGDGKFTGVETQCGESSKTTIYGQLDILSNTGEITCLSGICYTSLPANNAYGGYMNAGKTFSIETIGGGSGATAQLQVSIKQGSKYSQADLAGYWALNELDADSSGGYWSRMGLKVNSNGTFTGSGIGSDNTPSEISGTMKINSTGMITVTCSDCGSNSPVFYMDAGKTVFAGVKGKDPDTDSSFNVMIFTKQATGPLVNGACGWATGENFLTAPKSNLCTAGTASAVSTDNGRWSWNCAGSNGGATVGCYANIETNGACGSANNKVFVTAPTSGFCSAGSASAVTENRQKWNWTCAGLNGGSKVNCSANVAVQADMSMKLNGLTVTFTDTSTGPVTRRLWNFGDGKTSTLKTVSHTFKPGSYKVTLTVWGTGTGNESSASNTIIY